MTLESLRKKYPRFIYEKYSYKISGNNLEIFFEFKIEPNINFQPKISIKNIEPELIKRIGEEELNPVRNHRFLSGVNNFIFHLGLMEIPSYWKATCSPEILIKAGPLDKEQINWWKDLIIDGLGQFFFENKINFKTPNFLKFNPIQINNNVTLPGNVTLRGKEILVPVGGGKDSIVTLEVLKEAKKNIQCFSLNPTEAAQKIMKTAGFNNPIIVKRIIDPKLLELNRKGFLNGHTPFSAYLAFLSVLLAAVFNYKYIALSNERSSNEGNIRYLGKEINHQWSKSFDFEKRFRDYSKKYLSRDIEYFSFLRPLYEIQLAKLFSKEPKYFPIFLSCNEAYKTDSGRKKPSKKWCGNCSKCLFTFMILYPFVKESQLIKIFGKNLFNDKKLLPIMQQLIGERGFKPFECIGTKKESLTAFYLGFKKYIGDTYASFPVLLEYFKNKILPKYQNLEKESKIIMNAWNNQHNLPKNFKKILRKETSKED